MDRVRKTGKDDHLVLVFDQRFHEPKVTAYFSCLGKGQYEMTKSLRSLKQEMPYSKVKLYHPQDVDVEVYSKKTGEEVLELLHCPGNQMQAQQASEGAETDLYSYRRGDIPLFNFDEADRLLIATLQELIEALRRLKLEVKTQKEETVLLRKALMDCEACKISKPMCTDLPYPCFEGPPRVDCRDTVEGPECGPCPPGYKGNGRHCERDACGDEPCFEDVSCYPIIEEPFYKCGTCPKGYRGDGINCVPDICQRHPPPCFRDRGFRTLPRVRQIKKWLSKNGFRKCLILTPFYPFGASRIPIDAELRGE